METAAKAGCRAVPPQPCLSGTALIGVLKQGAWQGYDFRRSRPAGCLQRGSNDPEMPVCPISSLDQGDITALA